MRQFLFKRHPRSMPHRPTRRIHRRAPRQFYRRRNHKTLELNEDIIKDKGKEPYVINIEDATLDNQTYRTTIWTGEYLQSTLMKINVGDDIGLEIHPETDQFLRIEEGAGIAQMGNDKNNLTFERPVKSGDAVFVPANTWHNIINTSKIPLKLYSIYAPPHHKKGTVQVTKSDPE